MRFPSTVNRGLPTLLPWPLIEGRLDHFRGDRTVSNHDLKLCAHGRVLRCHVPEPDVLSEPRGRAPAGHLADRFATLDDRIMRAGDPTSDHFKADQLSANPLCLLPGQHLTADEVSLLRLHDPAEIGLEDRMPVVDVVAVEGHLCLEAQRVARAEPARLQARWGARVHQGVPAANSVLGLGVDLEAVLAGIACPGDAAIHTEDLPFGEPVVPDFP